MYTFAFIVCAMTAIFGFMAIVCELLFSKYFEDEEGEDYGYEK